MKSSEAWYDNSYSSSGFNAQRKYPNEELCRFIGRNFNQIPYNNRSNLRVLEVGCGSGGNLWMLCGEGFDVIGLDISSEGIALAKKMLKIKALNANFVTCSMCDMSKYINHDSIDVIVDVFSSNCLDEQSYHLYLLEIKKVLKSGGKLFTYTPSKFSDAFKNHGPSKLIDKSTLDGIKRKSSPFYGNEYPFRFESAEDIQEKLKDANFNITYFEKVGRTYNSLSEYFEFFTIEAVKL